MIINDDASAVNVESMVEPYMDPPHIRFFRSEKSAGIGGNWNQTRRWCTGKYVAYLFQDDLWHP